MRPNTSVGLSRKILSATAWCVLALVTASNAERLPVTNLTIANGLPTNTINRIVADSRGFFWICTGAGLSRYDGYGFTNFTTAHGLPGERVLDLLEAPSGEFWVATNGGLARFTPDGSTHDRVITSEESKGFAETPAFVTFVNPGAKHATRLAFDNNGRLWVGTANGLFRHDDGHFQKIELPFQNPDTNPHIYGLFPARDGSMWAGIYDNLFRITDTAVQSLYKPGTVFQSFAQDREGRVWVGTSHTGVLEVTADEAAGLSILRSFPALADAGSWVNAVAQSSAGKMWLATDDGLIEFDPELETPAFEIYTRTSGVGPTKFNSIVEDRAGNLWLGTRASGIYRIVRRGMISFGAEDNIEFVRALFACDGGQACFVGFLASNALDGSGAKAELEVGRNYFPYIWRLGQKKSDGFEWLRPNFARKVEYFGWGDRQNIFQSRNGEWWIGTGEGLFRFPGGEFAELTRSQPLEVFDASRGLAPVDVFSIFEDSHGDVWIASNGSKRDGLFRWRRETGELENLTARMRETVPAKSNFVSSFAEDREGSIWFGFYDSGVARLRDGRFEYYDETTGFPRGGGNDILVDANGKVWVASGREGVVMIDAGASDGGLTFTAYDTRHGLSSNRTFALTADWRNMIYVGTDREVNRIDPVSGKIIQVPFGDGLPQQQIRSAFTDAQGTLWFGATSGLLKYVPVPDMVPESLEVLFTSVRIEGARYKVSALGENRIDLGDLAPDSNQIELEFTTLSAVTGDRPRYQHKFSSSDTWSDLESGRTLGFAGLAPGDYQIEVRAVDATGAASNIPATVGFTILPPFYVRWWFLLLAASMVTAVAYMIYKNRLERLLELEKVRTRIATDLHDDIGANLTRISVLSEVAKQNSVNGNGALLESIAEIARESVGSMGDIVWAIAPEHDSLLDLTRVMRRHAEELFSLRNVDVQFRAPETDPKLSVGVRRDLLLIFKEAVHNAAKHSDCSRIEIDLSFKNSILHLRIADDGKGFTMDEIDAGHGLQSMRNRARALGGKLTIDSNGMTTVKLEVEFRKNYFSRL